MIDLIADNLTNTRLLAMIFAAVAAIATVLTFAMPLLVGDSRFGFWGDGFSSCTRTRPNMMVGFDAFQHGGEGVSPARRPMARGDRRQFCDCTRLVRPGGRIRRTIGRRLGGTRRRGHGTVLSFAAGRRIDSI